MIFFSVVGVWLGFTISDFKVEGFYRPQIRNLHVHRTLLTQIREWAEKIQTVKESDIRFLRAQLEMCKIVANLDQKEPGVKTLLKGLLSRKKKG